MTVHSRSSSSKRFAPVRLVLATIALASTCALLPAAARAAWTAPETIGLSASTVDTAQVELQTNAAGEAVVAWREGANLVRSALRPAGGPFGSSQTLDGNTGSHSPSPRSAIGPDGDAVVFWFSNDGGRKLRYADRASAEGSFASAQDLFNPDQDVNSLDVLIDSGSATHVAYNGPGFSFYPRVWTRTRAAGSATFGAESSIPANGNLSPGSPGRIVLGTAANGSSVLTYYSPSADVAPGSQQQHIEGAVRALGAAGWTVPVAPAHDWFCCLSLGPQGVSGLDMDAGGNTYFVVSGANDFADPPHPGPAFVLVGANGVVVQGRQQLDPAWSNGGTSGGDPQIAVDPDGNAWVAWARQVESAMVLFAAFRPAGAASGFEPTQQISTGLPANLSGTFRVIASESGALLVWQDGCGPGGCTLRSAFTDPASGDLGPSSVVATETRTGNVQLARLPNDGALVVYRREGGNLEARLLHTVLLELNTATPLLIDDVLARGITFQVVLGTDDVDLQVRLLDEARSLGLTRVVGRKVRTDMGQGASLVRIRLKPAALERLAARHRLRLDLEVVAIPLTGPSESMRQKVVLRR